MGESDIRLEGKLDGMTADVRGLTAAIHEQSLAIVKLVQQMEHTTEAIGRAHSRVDDVNSKIDLLQDLPVRVDYLERRVSTVEKQSETYRDRIADSKNRITGISATGKTISNFWPVIVSGSVIAALAVIGLASKYINSVAPGP